MIISLHLYNLKRFISIHKKIRVLSSSLTRPPLSLHRLFLSNCYFYCSPLGIQMLRPFPRCYFAFHKWPAHIQFRQLRLHRLNTRNFHAQNWWNFNDKNHLENFSEKILLGCTVELHGPKTNLTSFAEIPLRKHVQCSSIVSIYDGSGTMWNWKIIGWENWWFDNSHYTHIAIHTHTELLK